MSTGKVDGAPSRPPDANEGVATSSSEPVPTTLQSQSPPYPSEPVPSLKPQPSSPSNRILSVTTSSKDGTTSSPKSGSTQTCAKCQRSISGQYVRALGATHHMDCFRCRDCDIVVAAKFFPVDAPDGTQFPLCERDYFRRLDLICSKCSGALRGSYITALDRKYHIEHFTCSICPTVFGQHDSYYEHDGNVYCHYHYSTKFAVKCSGCQTAILKQFVEINRNNVEEHWHPECYMIHKFWNVKLAISPPEHIRASSTDEPDKADAEALRKQQRSMEDKVYRIWTVLSAFEESSAACISDMLLHVSNGAYVEGVAMAEKFIIHVEILFEALDALEGRLQAASGSGLSFNRESKMLCKKIVNFFSLLSHTQESGAQRMGITQELLSLVTGLAHYLKMLIRIALTGALRLEREFHDGAAINDFLGKLVELAKDKQQPKRVRPTINPETSSDLCHRCRLTVEEECFKFENLRWHLACFQCGRCGRDLARKPRDALFHRSKGIVLCTTTCREDPSQCSTGFEYVTRLEQYAFLLRIALARLHTLLKSKNMSPQFRAQNMPLIREPHAPHMRREDSESALSELHKMSNASSNPAPPTSLQAEGRSNSYALGENRSGSGVWPEPPESFQSPSPSSLSPTDVKRMKSLHLDRKLSNSARTPRRSTIIETSAADTQHSTGSTASDRQANVGSSKLRIVEDSRPEEDGDDITFDDAEVITLADIPSMLAAQSHPSQKQDGGRYEVRDRQHLHKPPSSGARKTSHTLRGKKYLSELSALEYFIVKHVAVLMMEETLRPYFTLEELLDLIETRKTTLWGKFAGAFKGADKKSQVKKKGVFGVPLEVLIERNGVESLWGAGPVRLRIPSFVDESISAMRQMDMSVEGVFRKNGNIRRLKDLSEAMDRDPGSVNLNDDSPVQLAALLKKFLREMPDPLLTFKLHKVWVSSQRVEDEAERKRLLHLICCLLPRCHRDAMEALFCFLRWVASFSHVDEESGSKMDLYNISTVICPNILYSKSKDPTKDESFAAINAVYSLLQCAEDFAMVPDDLQAVLQDQDMFAFGPEELTTKDILKRAESYVRARRNNPMGETVVSNVEAVQPHRPSVTAKSQMSMTQGVHGAYDINEMMAPASPVNGAAAANRRSSMGITGMYPSSPRSRARNMSPAREQPELFGSPTIMGARSTSSGNQLPTMSSFQSGDAPRMADLVQQQRQARQEAAQMTTTLT